jgi:hypothetical protein
MVARFVLVTDGAGLSAEAALPALNGFREAEGTVFRVKAGDGHPVELTLTEVSETARPPGWESFSLLFLGAEGALSQGTHQVEHGDLGSFPLFLVPIVGDGDGHLYEAVFNRPAP